MYFYLHTDMYSICGQNGKQRRAWSCFYSLQQSDPDLHCLLRSVYLKVILLGPSTVMIVLTSLLMFMIRLYYLLLLWSQGFWELMSWKLFYPSSFIYCSIYSKIYCSNKISNVLFAFLLENLYQKVKLSCLYANALFVHHSTICYMINFAVKLYTSSDHYGLNYNKKILTCNWVRN